MPTRTHIYSTICWLLAVCFAAVGAALVFAPDLLAAVIEGIGALLSLDGEIAVAPGSLDHALAVSLMATITYLAVVEARQTGSQVVYRALQTAKITSTFAFLYLTLTADAVWLVATVADGSVIVILAVARPSSSSPG